MANENESVADVGQNEAETVNMKMVVADEKDLAGRTRSYYDVGMHNVLTAQMMMMSNFGVGMGALNQQIVALVKQGLISTGKTDENLIGVNMTDVMERSIAGTPWEDFAKAVASMVIAAQNKTAEAK